MGGEEKVDAHACCGMHKFCWPRLAGDVTHAGVAPLLMGSCPRLHSMHSPQPRLSTFGSQACHSAYYSSLLGQIPSWLLQITLLWWARHAGRQVKGKQQCAKMEKCLTVGRFLSFSLTCSSQDGRSFTTVGCVDTSEVWWRVELDEPVLVDEGRGACRSSSRAVLPAQAQHSVCQSSLPKSYSNKPSAHGASRPTYSPKP